MQTFKALLGSRKVLVALATLIGCILAQRGFDVDEAMITNILIVGVSLIGGIAVEDAAKKFGLPPNP